MIHDISGSCGFYGFGGFFYVAHSGAVNVNDTNLLTCSLIMTVLLAWQIFLSQMIKFSCSKILLLLQVIKVINNTLAKDPILTTN